MQSLPKQNFIGEKNYACKSSVSVSAEPNISRITSTFDFKNTWFFCGASTNNNKQKKTSLYRAVKMVSNCMPTPNQFHETLMKICEERGDEWGESVHSRILDGFNFEN